MSSVVNQALVRSMYYDVCMCSRIYHRPQVKLTVNIQSCFKTELLNVTVNVRTYIHDVTVATV